MLTLLAAFALAQSCPQPIDYNTSSVGYDGLVSPTEFVELGGWTYFPARTLATGIELFRTDGTAAGTQLVADVLPGEFGSSPRSLFAHQGTLFFTADTPSFGRELWKSDGTAAGTVLVKDLAPGSASSNPLGFASAGSALVFSASDPLLGTEPFVSDGTTAGTGLLIDIVAGASSSVVSQFASLPGGGQAVFFAYAAPNTPVLILTDGTVAGTSPLAFVSKANSTEADPFMALGNELYFFGKTASGTSLWKTDGTLAGTQSLASPLLAMSAEFHAELGGELYFFGSAAGLGKELWKTDGVSTLMVNDTVPGLGSSVAGPLGVLGGEVYWLNHPFGGVDTVMATQGTPATTRVVATLPASVNTGGARNLISDGTHIMFSPLSDFGCEPYLVNASGTGASLLADLSAGPSSSIQALGFTLLPNGNVLFVADTQTVGSELFVTDGTPAGTQLVTDLGSGTLTKSSNPSSLAAVGADALYLMASSAVSAGQDALCLNTKTNTFDVLWQDANQLTTYDAQFTPFWDGQALKVGFANQPPGDSVAHLSITDGSVAGTIPTAAVVVPQVLDSIACGKRLLFTANDGFAGIELFATDGTLAGAVELGLTSPAAFGSNPINFVAFGDRVLFNANGGTTGRELWITDGTVAGSQLVLDINPTGDSHPAHLTRVGDRVLFFATSIGAFDAFDLWSTDGTAAGTLPLALLGQSMGSSSTPELPVVDGIAYFVADSPGLGEELWRTDLTPAGTYPVLDLQVGASGSQPTFLTAANSKLFFLADEGVGIGRELYVTDGTAAGTHLVADLTPGPFGTTFYDLIAVGTGVYFVAATDLVPGSELYLTDGQTVTGLCDLSPGADPFDTQAESLASPRHLTLAGGDLFMTATQANGVGNELHRLAMPGAHVIDLGLSGSALMLEGSTPLLGGPVTVSGFRAPIGKISVLAMSAPLGKPVPNPLLGEDPLWLDLATFRTLGFFATSNWTFTQSLPTTAALVGAQFNVQALTVDPVSLTGWESSNGLRLVLGN